MTSQKWPQNPSEKNYYVQMNPPPKNSLKGPENTKPGVIQGAIGIFFEGKRFLISCGKNIQSEFHVFSDALDETEKMGFR